MASRNLESIGFALRPGVFSAGEMIDAASVIDRIGKEISVFIPDGRVGLEAVEVASSLLNRTKNIHAGSGVIRLLEHDIAGLARRIYSLQAFSSNRFFLGVGTGRPTSQPGVTVTALLESLEILEKLFRAFPSEVMAPRIYVAALRHGLARRAARKGHSLLMNFCSPQHAKRVIDGVAGKDVTFACYLKLFYSSEGDDVARRLMVQEFLNYDMIPQYHEMFVQDGTANAISRFRNSSDWKTGRVELPAELLRVSLANPSSEELERYVASFRDAGIVLPVVYPYFPNGEKSEHKLGTVKRTASAVSHN